ncbi:MAG: hypothetical protein ACRDCB_11865 [Clostridium sp.]|uniref:hypothetical protein n=1 Tax=Clostridium sp. TaxID=1506 RepID=UPI003EE78E03
MKIERIFEVEDSTTLQEILKSLFSEKIDKTIEAFYSTTKDNHTTSSQKGDVTTC